MLLVVLGAGSSYDSLPAFPPNEESQQPDRPPLADLLFENRPVFREAMRRFPAIQPIIPLLQRRHGRSLEQQLQLLASEATAYPARFQQLMAVRYYIQYILRRIEDPWLREVGSHVTNFKSMLDEIDRCFPSGKSVCIVTFNYDRLVEDALRSRGIAISTLQDFVVDTRFKLFKVHGSIDWVRHTEIGAAELENPTHQWSAADSVTDRAARLTFNNEFSIVMDYPTGVLNGELVAPAIAIPLEDKTDFECPKVHLNILSGLLPQITHVLIVGWRATEQHFLRLLKSVVTRTLNAYIACGDRAAGDATKANLSRASIQAHFEVFDGGFTDMVTKRAYSDFLKSPPR